MVVMVLTERVNPSVVVAEVCYAAEGGFVFLFPTSQHHCSLHLMHFFFSFVLTPKTI